MNKKLNDYLGINSPRKVKHAKLIMDTDINSLEKRINSFADENPNYKILGIKVCLAAESTFLATITYLETSGGYFGYGPDEETDSD